jgi:hypothetical protein
MRHEQISATDSYAKVDIAAVWPTGAQPAPLPIPDVEQVAHRPQQAMAAAPDVPAAVGKLIIASYVVLLAAFAMATIASSYSIYTMVICAITLAAYFTVPWLFFTQERAEGLRPTLESFMEDGMETMTGHSTGGAALVQMMIVPVSLTLGVVVMGIAAAIIM